METPYVHKLVLLVLKFNELTIICLLKKKIFHFYNLAYKFWTNRFIFVKLLYLTLDY